MHALIAAYKRAAEIHGEAMWGGSSRKANAAADKMRELIFEIDDLSLQNEFLSLLTDENLSVVGWAAVHSLEIDEAAALAALRKIEEMQVRSHSFNAKYAIKEWNKGRLRIRS